ALMKQYSGLKINLDSHTDSRGSSTYNEGLSYRRSQAAKDYLLAAGVEENRLITTAQGEQALINECNDFNPCSERDHRLNRRTQFSLVISNTLSTL
ncbi:MAG: OmpA family protein, partial [Cyclobacteriaceae bacterium]|nr:OmpA family protein [Cyclobacteriaceae bacterium]